MSKKANISEATKEFVIEALSIASPDIDFNHCTDNHVVIDNHENPSKGRKLITKESFRDSILLRGKPLVG